MNRHLVAVEVRVERVAHERVDLDGLALDQDRLESLDAEAVQGGRAVQQHRVFLDDLFEDIPHLRAATLDHALGRLDVLGQLVVDELLHDERLEQLECHQLGQTALVQLERRADNDDRTAGVVDALAEQVLAEPALLALQHVGERLERAVTRTGDRSTATAVVEQRVDGLLQHALLVVHDDLGSTEIEQSLEAVVPVDHSPVQVVEVGRGEAATVELHHRAQFRRDDRDDVEDHRPWVVDPTLVIVAAVERRHDLEALDGLLLALRAQRTLTLGRVDGLAELDLFDVEIDAIDQTGDGVGTHAAFEVVAVAVDQLAPEQLVFDDLASEEVLELVERTSDEIELHLVLLADRGDVLLGRAAARVQLGFLHTLLLEIGKLVLELLEALIDLLVALLFDLLTLTDDLGLDVRQIGVALLFVDPGDQVGGEVDDLLELLGLQLLAHLGAHEEVGQPRTGAAEVPDVHHRCGELDVAHALTAHLRARDLDAATLADDALETDALVLTAVALPVLGRTEDLLAEESVLLGLERAVVDGLRLLDLAVRPGADLVGGRETDTKLIEFVHIEHRHGRSVAPRVLSCYWRDERLLRRCLARDGTSRYRAPRRCGRCPRRAHASRSLRRWPNGPRR